MNTIEFQGWPKTPRLFRNCVVSEKIDGTNAAIGIRPYPFGWHVGGTDSEGVNHDQPDYALLRLGPDDGEDGLPTTEYLVWAQSRKRIITTDADNYGFAAWVEDNAQTLITDLGPGLHYGEYWGRGINRGYGMATRVFSLFNTEKWGGSTFETPGLNTVPVITKGTFNSDLALSALDQLRQYGSLAAPGYMNPEGVCIYHSASNQVYKATLDADERPKTLASISPVFVPCIADGSPIELRAA